MLKTSCPAATTSCAHSWCIPCHVGFSLLCSSSLPDTFFWPLPTTKSCARYVSRLCAYPDVLLFPFAISIQLSMHFLFPSTFHFFCSHSFPILFPFFFCFCSTLSVNISTLLFPFQSSLFSLIPISLFYSIPLFTISIPPASEERDHQSRRCSPQHPRDPRQEGPPSKPHPKPRPNPVTVPPPPKTGELLLTILFVFGGGVSPPVLCAEGVN